MLRNKLIGYFSTLKNNSNLNKIAELFIGSSHILTRNKIDSILNELVYRGSKIPGIPRKPYQLDEVQYLVKYFLKMLQRKRDNMKAAINGMK